jgi:hypothetical protein
MDEAFLVESRDGRRSAVKICLGTLPGAAPDRCYIAAGEEGDASAMGVETRAPGCHTYTRNEHDTVTDSNIARVTRGWSTSGWPVRDRCWSMTAGRMASSGSGTRTEDAATKR